MFLQALLNAGRCGVEMPLEEQSWRQSSHRLATLQIPWDVIARHYRNSLVETWEPEGWLWEAPLAWAYAAGCGGSKQSVQDSPPCWEIPNPGRYCSPCDLVSCANHIWHLKFHSTRTLWSEQQHTKGCFCLCFCFCLENTLVEGAHGQPRSWLSTLVYIWTSLVNSSKIIHNLLSAF